MVNPPPTVEQQQQQLAAILGVTSTDHVFTEADLTKYKAFVIDWVDKNLGSFLWSDAIVSYATDVAARPWIGKKLSELTSADFNSFTVNGQNVGRLIFGGITATVPGGPTQVESGLGVVAGVGAFFTWLLSINWLFVIAAIVGAFLLWKGYNQISADQPVTT